MACRLLLVFDDAACASETAAAARRLDATEVLLLAFSGDAELAERMRAELEALGIPTRALEAARLVSEEVALVRASVGRWSAELGRSRVGGRSIREALALPELGVSAWWFGLASERNTLKTDAFLRLAQLGALGRALAQPECAGASVVVAVADAAWSRSLRQAARRAGAAARELSSSEGPGASPKSDDARSWLAAGLGAWARMIWRSLRARAALGSRKPRATVEASLVFVSYFPALDAEALRLGRFRNKFAGPLQDALAQGAVRPVWLLHFVGLEGRSFPEALSLARAVARTGEAVFFLEEFLGIGDALRGLAAWLAIAWRARGLWARLDRGVLLAAPARGEEALPILSALWRRSFYGPQCVEGILYTMIFRRAFRELADARDCVYLCERHHWEKALEAAAAAVAPRLRTIAYQHGSMLGNFFNYFQDPSETGREDGPWPLPLPKVTAANGETPRRLLEESRFPNLARVEALRYLGLAARLNEPFQPSAKAALLVAGSIDARETRALAALVCQAFPKAEGLAIVFKGHPFMPFEPVLAALGVDFEARGYEFASGGIDDCLKASTLVLTAGSGVALEALAFGREVIVPLFADVMPMSPLGESLGLARRVSSPEELRAAVAQALAGRRFADVEEGRNFVRRYWDLDLALPRWRTLLALPESG